MDSQTVYIVGASSTGKTTLCRALAQELNMPLVAEVARTVMSQQNFTRDDVATSAMQEAIFHAQLSAQKTALEKHPAIIGDRSAIDPIAYALLHAPSPDEKDRRFTAFMSKLSAHNEVLLHYQRSLFILLLPVPQFVQDDGVRSLEKASDFSSIFRELMGALQLPYKEIGIDTVNLRQRVELVKSWL